MKVEVWTAIFVYDKSHITLCGHFGSIDEAEACGASTTTDMAYSGAKFIGVSRSFMDVCDLCELERNPQE